MASRPPNSAIPATSVSEVDSQDQDQYQHRENNSSIQAQDAAQDVTSDEYDADATSYYDEESCPTPDELTPSSSTSSINGHTAEEDASTTAILAGANPRTDARTDACES
ncbi:hypothetical protein BDV97DRAFT_345296 [Delphinella strobiligena]|nr:hypothetical protein BDV97DRAFT_345296 [Delphinella strobiligena]